MTVSNNQHLKILSIGAGALGTYIGGSLALHGHEVVFLEQPKVAGDLRRRALRLNLRGVEHSVTNFTVTGFLDEAMLLGPFDVGLFALKSFDTQTVIKTLVDESENLPPFLCLQNGVDNERALRKIFGKDKVIAGTVTSAVGRRDAGDIVLERLRGIGIASGHPLSKRLAQAFSSAGLNAQLFSCADNMKWSKMLTNLLANASSAILDMPPAEIFAHPGLFALEISQLRECLAVMRAKNIHAVNLPKTPVRALAFAVRRLPLALSRPILTRAVGGGRGDKMPSFHIDLHSGRGKSEVNYLNGAVVHAGKKSGIPTPVNKLLNDTLRGLTKGQIQMDEFRGKPERLITQTK
ncbi:MAG: ketopantoate reductase family protein [Chloroflexi bacterium]|nr:ketopantoate reductase family protein [Chloroflexota bacterium]